MGARRWNFFSSVQRDISQVSVANEWDIEKNTRREIPYLQAIMFYCDKHKSPKYDWKKQ